MKTVAELEAELEVARAAERANRNALLESVKPVMKYRAVPSTRMSSGKIFDPAVVRYDVEGIVTNRDECLAAGHSESAIRDGAMVYLFNQATGKVIMHDGGGTLYLESFSASSNATADAMRELGLFLRDNPEGGDITYIVEAYRAAIGLR